MMMIMVPNNTCTSAQFIFTTFINNKNVPNFSRTQNNIIMKELALILLI